MHSVTAAQKMRGADIHPDIHTNKGNHVNFLNKWQLLVKETNRHGWEYVRTNIGRTGVSRVACMASDFVNPPGFVSALWLRISVTRSTTLRRFLDAWNAWYAFGSRPSRLHTNKHQKHRSRETGSDIVS